MSEDPTPSRTDPAVDRANDLVTTALDTAGVIALAVAAFLGARVWADAWGFLAAGLVLMAFSGLAQRRSRPRKVKVPPGAHPHRPILPGPEDPGNLHVKGR